VNALEQDALEVLCLVRSFKNLFAPINEIPHDVLSLLPDYWNEYRKDQNLITLTHVCRGWRGTFTSRSSLWARLDFSNVDKTRTYIERSGSFPLEIHLDGQDTRHLDTFSLAIPHLHRLKSLSMSVNVLPDVLKHFCCQTPLLEDLRICLYSSHNPTLDRTLFDGDLSSLRKLTLGGTITISHLPWNNMKNLQFLDLRDEPYDVTQLLDFFESAPLLHTIELENSIPDSSDAPPHRIVTLPHLKALTIEADPPHSILLNHLCIPTGASLVLRFYFSNQISPLLDCLSESSTNLKNLSHITTINLRFDSEKKAVRLSGPSGSLRLSAYWQSRETGSHTADHRILHSLDRPPLSTTQRLVISKYRHPYQAKGSQIFQCLSSMNSLRILVLAECDNLPFLHALNPEENVQSTSVPCPDLKELVLYIGFQDQFHIEHLISMVKNRASRGAKLSSITIMGLDEPAPGGQVFKLEEHVTHVTYKVGGVPPAWDDIPGESGGESR